jgi:WD40 repeat protein
LRVFIGTRESGLQVLDWATRLVITNLPASGPNATPIDLVNEGRTLVVSSGRGTVVLWDTLSWKQIAAWQLDEDGSPIPAPTLSATGDRPANPAAAFRFSWFQAPMAASPDGLSILIRVDDGGVEVRDLRSGELRFTVSAHPWDVSSLAWAPDGTMFASASADGMVNLYDPTSGEVLDVLRGHLLGVHAIAFSPDGRRLASSSHGSEAVKLWDVTTRHEVATLAGNNALFSQVDFSPDGELLIAVNASGEAHVWRAPTTP